MNEQVPQITVFPLEGVKLLNVNVLSFLARTSTWQEYDAKRPIWSAFS